MILFVGGSSSFKSWDSQDIIYSNPDSNVAQYLSYLCNEGFAILNVCGYDTRYKHYITKISSKDTSKLAYPDIYSNFPIPSFNNTRECGVKYVLDRYNIDTNRIYLLAKSLGGQVASWYTMRKPEMFNFKAVCMLSPSIDTLSVPSYRGGMFYKKYYRNSIASKELGFTDGTFDTYYPLLDTNTDPIKNYSVSVSDNFYVSYFDPTGLAQDIKYGSDEGRNPEKARAFLLWNIGKFSSYNAAFFNEVGRSERDKLKASIENAIVFGKYVTAKTKQESERTTEDNSIIADYESEEKHPYRDINLSRLTVVPFKIWSSIDDTNTPHWMCDMFVKQAQNAGASAELKTMPIGCGGHSSVDESASVIDSNTGEYKYPTVQAKNVKTQLGINYSVVPLAYFEVASYMKTTALYRDNAYAEIPEDEEISSDELE